MFCFARSGLRRICFCTFTSAFAWLWRDKSWLHVALHRRLSYCRPLALSGRGTEDRGRVRIDYDDDDEDEDDRKGGKRDQLWTLNFKVWTHRVAVCRFLLISRLGLPAICWALSPRVSWWPRRAESIFVRSGAGISALQM